MSEIKLFGIESKSTYYGPEYRYYSRYNGARGAWTPLKKEAVAAGEEHQKIIIMLHGNKQEATNVE